MFCDLSSFHLKVKGFLIIVLFTERHILVNPRTLGVGFRSSHYDQLHLQHNPIFFEFFFLNGTPVMTGNVRENPH